MVPAFLGKPKPPLPVSGSQASNATWRWNWCSFLNCVRRRMAMFFFVQHLEFFSFPVFLCSLSIIQSFYPVFLYFPSANRDLWWFLHQPTVSRLPGHRGTRGFIWILCDFLGSVHVMSFHVHRTQFPSWTVVPVEEKPMKQLSLYCSTSMKTN